MAQAVPHRVYTRTRWGDPWVVSPWLYCTQVKFAANPALPEAELIYEFGQILRPGASRFEEFQPEELAGQWVKIEIDQEQDANGGARVSIHWFGRIYEQTIDRTGELTAPIDSSNVTSKTGKIYFRCLGLEAELLRSYVERSMVETTTGEQQIGRAIGFNRAQGFKSESHFAIRGNATKTYSGAKSTKLFCKDMTQGDVWTAQDMLEYLFAYFTPRDVAGNATIPWELDEDSQLSFLSWHTPPLDVHGQTLKEILDTLIDRRRLVGYRVKVDPEGGDEQKVLISVFSFSDETISLDDGTTLEANANQKTLKFDQAIDVLSATITQSLDHAVDVVRVVGARRGSCFTVSAKDSTLVKDWSSSDETAYEAAASAETGYSGLKRDEKEYRNDRRRLEPTLERVFRYFALPQTWDGSVKDGTNGGSQVTVDPVVPPDDTPFEAISQSVNNTSKFWRAGIRLENHLPFKQNVDYSGTKIADGETTDNNPTGSDPAYLAPFVIIKNTLAASTGTGSGFEYEQIDKLSAAQRVDHMRDWGRDWNGSTRMQPRGAGIIIDVRGNEGACQHKLASADFSSGVTTGGAEDATEIAAELDWNDNLLATVFWLTDDYVEVTYPLDAEIAPDIDSIREQRIDLGDDFRLDFVAPQTVVSVSKGELVRSTSGGFIRDDRAKMLALAQIAYQWYGRIRQSFSLTFRQVADYVKVGDLITTIGDDANPEPINTVVTQVILNLVEHTTTIATDFGTLDVRAFVPPQIDNADTAVQMKI